MITLDALARPSGTFLMVAMDQRESLRKMMGGDAPDERLVAFKLAVARELSPHASALLIDRHYGFEQIVREGLAACSVILAADVLDDASGVVQDTDVDYEIEPEGVAALKFLVIWRDDDERPRRLETTRRFVELAESHGLLSVVEGIVRVPDEAARDDAIIEAAAELSSVGPSLYKVEVPHRGRGDAGEITRRCREIDAVVPMPWVVLSNGVELADFPRAVEASCRGGASGMLAGRAIWSDLVQADDPGPLLCERSVPRLEQLAEIVDRVGRPWREKR